MTTKPPSIIEVFVPEDMINTPVVKVVKLSDGTTIKCDVYNHLPDDYYERKRHGTLMEFIVSGKQHVRVHINHIVYISVEKHWCNFVFDNEEPKCAYGSLNTILNILHSGGYKQFLRIHDSYIVNSDYITGIINNCISLKNIRCTIPIGRAYKHVFDDISFCINPREKK